MTATAFDTILDAFASKLAEATAVCANIYTDDVVLPEGDSTSIVLQLVGAEAQVLGELAGNPVDWVTQIAVRCIASANAASARAVANALAGAAYARLAATPSLGITGVWIGEPVLEWETETAATRLASAQLTYNVQHRTVGLTLA